MKRFLVARPGYLGDLAEICRQLPEADQILVAAQDELVTGPRAISTNEVSGKPISWNFARTGRMVCRASAGSAME